MDFGGEEVAGVDGSWIVRQMITIGTFSVISGAACLTVLTGIASSSTLRRSPHVYVLNALLLALIRSLGSLPLRMMILSKRFENNFSSVELNALCKLFTFSAVLSQFGILYTLLATSLDCYITVVHGRLGVHRCRGLVYCPIMLCIWGLAFVTALLEVYGHTEVNYHCYQTPNTPSAMSSVTWLFLLVFLVCWAISNLLYLRTYCFMRNYRRMRPYFQGPQINNGWVVDQRIGNFHWTLPPSNLLTARCLLPSPQKNVHVAMCASLNVVCCLLWLPSLILCMSHFLSVKIYSYQFVFSKVYSRFGESQSSVEIVDTVCSSLELLHLLVVPVLYVCLCPVFRQVLLESRNNLSD